MLQTAEMPARRTGISAVLKPVGAGLLRKARTGLKENRKSLGEYGFKKEDSNG
jgi:hypothetical protein